MTLTVSQSERSKVRRGQGCPLLGVVFTWLCLWVGLCPDLLFL